MLSKILVIICVLFVILLFIYIFSNYAEGLIGYESCPDMLIQKGTQYLLYNTYNPESATNPIIFDNLNQYAEYVKTESDKGKVCPILFVQQVSGAQGETTYKIRNDPLNPQDIDYKSSSSIQTNDGTGSVSSSTENSQTKEKYTTPYSRQIYMDNLASNIVQNLTTNEVTNIDKLELTKSILLQSQPTCSKTMDDIKPLEINGLTPDPMQTNWGGAEFSDNIVNQGYYAGNEITKSTMGSMN